MLYTVFENHIKSLIQHCEQSEQSLHLNIQNAKMVNFGDYLENLKPEDFSQTVLPDKTDLIRQKLVKNAKIKMQYFE